MISQPCSIDINTAWFNRAVMDLRPVNTARLVCKQSSIEKYWFPNLHVKNYLLNRNVHYGVSQNGLTLIWARGGRFDPWLILMPVVLMFGIQSS